MKKYIKKVRTIEKNRKIYKRIIFRKELYTFKNTYNFRILKTIIGDNCKNKAKLKKIRDKNIQDNIRNILDNTNSFKERAKSFFNTLEKDFKELFSPKKDIFEYTSEYYEIPKRYNETVIKVLAQTPKKLFAYWDISDNDIYSYVNNYGEEFFDSTKPILIVENIKTGNIFEIDIDPFANSWYIDIEDNSSLYVIKYARKVLNNLICKNDNNDHNIPKLYSGNIIHFATSNNIISPNRSYS